MSSKTIEAPIEEISNWIYQAATADIWRPGHHLRSRLHSTLGQSDLAYDRIKTALHRAQRKTYVRAIKPFRRVLRNQGAVNDSLIEAAYQLSVQNEEMMEQISALRSEVAALNKKLNDLASQWRKPPAVTPGAEQR